jgi:hypothetical protein
MHFTLNHWIDGSLEIDSGLWHQRHLRGQSLKKTVVRIPGPSSVLIFWISKIYPESASASVIVNQIFSMIGRY